MIEDTLPHSSLLGLGQHLVLTRTTASRPGQQCVPATGMPLARQLSTALTDTLNRPATSTDTGSNRTSSGDHVRASPPDHSLIASNPENQSVSDQ
ncbi:hypothetical protein [Streptomyces celluloflavus]|uniref:hypothetical protein n=1 Tax=Streptomyces celluloflavus TaxID=58344 RepID=UPI003673E31F